MENLLHDNKTYQYYEFKTEAEFEKLVVEKSSFIFGKQSIYIDIKKRIGDSIITIPDGYLIDFSFEAEPRLYIIENELSSHDPYKHIGAQLLKFAISYKASGRKIKTFLLQHLLANTHFKQQVEKGLSAANYRNIDDFLESLIFEKPVAAIVVIDKSKPELENVLGQLTMDTDILEFQAFKCGDEFIYKYNAFNEEIREVTGTKGSDLKPEELDTIVVPAKAEGFEEEFLANHCWYAIRINAVMIDRIKYIAAYQVAPVSAITHYAEVASIEKWEDTNKYILKFKSFPIELKKIPLDKDIKGMAPQAPRYTSLKRLLKAKKLSEVF